MTHKPVQFNIHTIGRSTRPIDDFISILKAYGIKILADVRSVPGSKHAPQYSQKPLADAVQAAGSRVQQSINSGWRNSSFRGYADYMQTKEFEHALSELIGIARRQPTSIMCAEAVPWRCHRSLIADPLLIRGINVINIFTAVHHEIHQLTPFARVNGLSITYPAESYGEIPGLI